MACLLNHICYFCTFVDIREEIAMIEEGKMDIAINPLKVCLPDYSSLLTVVAFPVGYILPIDMFIC